MNTSSEEPTLHELLSRVAALEQANGRLQEELTSLGAERAAAEEQANGQKGTRTRKSSRRKVLEKGLGVAVATVGAGALLELSGGTALASDPAKAGVFASSTAGTPAVRATGSSGADGVDATSDSGTGVKATSITGLAGHFVGNVNMDNNLTVTGALSTGTLSSGAGTLASSASGTPAVKASGTSGADGVDATSDSGIGVSATSGSGTGLVAKSISGLAGNFMGSVNVGGSLTSGPLNATSVSTGPIRFTDLSGGPGFFNSGGTVAAIQARAPIAGFFVGDVEVQGNFSATGTKAFVEAHPTDPNWEIVYIALEGGEAGTYVRGSGQLQSGKAVIALPEHFGFVTATEGLTVQLTPRGEWLQLYVVELDTAQIVVREAQGKSGEFDYLVHGVRRGYEQHEVIRTKR